MGKNKGLFLAGILSMALIFSLALIGCSDGDGGNGGGGGGSAGDSNWLIGTWVNDTASGTTFTLNPDKSWFVTMTGGTGKTQTGSEWTDEAGWISLENGPLIVWTLVYTKIDDTHLTIIQNRDTTFSTSGTVGNYKKKQ